VIDKDKEREREIGVNLKCFIEQKQCLWAKPDEICQF